MSGWERQENTGDESQIMYCVSMMLSVGEWDGREKEEGDQVRRYDICERVKE